MARKPPGHGGGAVELTVHHGVAWVTFQRPSALNALDRACVGQLVEHLTTLRGRADARVVVTLGAGRAYCAGSDLDEIASLSPADVAALEREHARAADLLATLPQPSIAMLHGYALGGGLMLALYHDLRLAASSAVLGLPEVELGWTPPWGLARLVEVVGEATARWLLLTGARVTGSEARAIGLVQETAEDEQLRDRVEELAQKLARLPPAAVGRTRALLDEMSRLRSTDWDAAASRAFDACYSTPEARASVAAFRARDRSGNR